MSTSNAKMQRFFSLRIIFEDNCGASFFGFQQNIFVGVVHYTSKHILHRGGKERSDDINGVLGIPTDFRTLWP